MKSLRIGKSIASWAVVTAASVIVLCANSASAQMSATTSKGRPALATTPVVSADGRLWIIGVNEEGKLFTQQTAQALPARIQINTQPAIKWLAPRVIDTGGERVSADGQNRPKLLFLKDGRWLVTYTKPSAKPYTGDVVYQLSADQGQSWTAPGKVHRDEQVITHRFESVTQTTDGEVHIAWVDKRDAEASKLNGQAYRGAAIYRSVLLPGADRFEPETKLTDHTCECCHIAMAATQTGEIALMWRHVFEPNIRDHALAFVSRERQTRLQRVTFDNWSVDACPHQGPALTHADDGSLHAVWFGIRNGQATVRYARLTDEPGNDTSEALPDERAEFADIIANGNRVWTVWRRFDAKQWQLVVREGTVAGRMIGKTIVAQGHTDNDIPRLFNHGPNTWALWRHSDGVRVIPVGTSEPVNTGAPPVVATTAGKSDGKDAEKAAEKKVEKASAQRDATHTNPNAPRRFTEKTWAQWLTQRSGPAVVMFTSSDCAHCPGALKLLRDHRYAHRSTWSLRIVSIDEPPPQTHATPHRTGSMPDETLWQFAGPTRALQYAINPQWRGMTPYVVLLPSVGEPQFILGSPTPQQLDTLR